eukprot:jgi/Tetstr1/441650/TSEL_029875.t1
MAASATRPSRLRAARQEGAQHVALACGAPQRRGLAARPGSSAQNGGNGDGEEEDSATYIGEIKVACGNSKGAARHEISSRDTSKAAAPGVPANRPHAPGVPGHDAQELCAEESSRGRGMFGAIFRHGVT